MGKVTILNATMKNPISFMGEIAGYCYGVKDLTNQERNYKRAIDCLESGHGRVMEFPEVYMIIEGFSARVIREWYTHVGGLPTRLQASTRYIDYESGFDYVVPHSIEGNKEAEDHYRRAMNTIKYSLHQMEKAGIPREDCAMVLPLGMETTIVCQHNLRNLVDMSHQRMCTRAYWEYRELFNAVCDALREYSEEWAYLVDNYFQPKCEWFGYCPEKKSCGRKPKNATS